MLVFYPDRFLLLDFVFCFCTLLVYGVASRQKIRWFRMIAAAITASVFSMAGVLFRIYGIYPGVSVIPLFLMVVLYVVSQIGFGGKTKKTIINALGIGFITVAEGGVLIFILMMIRSAGVLSRGSIPFALVMSQMFQFVFLVFWGRTGKKVLKMQKSALIVIDGQSFTALIDSGNLLKDKNGSPVIIFTSAAGQVLEKVCEDKFFIEVHTAVGKDMLGGGYIRETLICSPAGREKIEHLAVCFTTKESFGGNFDAVIPTELVCSKSGKQG